MDIIGIKKRIKKGKRVRFIVDYDKNYMILVEKVLLEFGYRWNGFATNKPLNFLCGENPFTININTNNISTITFNTMSNDVCDVDVIVSELTEYQLNNLFINEPIYKPIRIIRII